MKISQEGAILMKKMLSNEYVSRSRLNEFPVSGWKWRIIDSLLKKILFFFSKPEVE